MIENKQYIIKKSEIKTMVNLPNNISQLMGQEALRWYITQITEDEITIEATVLHEVPKRFAHSVTDEFHRGNSVVLSIIPTSVGCEIGGYAGDASPATNLLAATADYLITNPNAVNASNFIHLASNIIYTEGYTIDLFCQGLANLYRPYTNTIGLIVEKALPQHLDIVFNILNATRSTYGINIKDVVVTEQRIGSRCSQNPSGAFVGTIDNPKALLDACEELITKGVDAIAVTTDVQNLPVDSYALHYTGLSSNPLGGVEAIISHLITRHYEIPSAHAPMINFKEMDLKDKVVDARAAGEISSSSGLACILIGLQKAPQIKVHATSRISDIINLNNLVAIVVPAGCLGGVPVLTTRQWQIPVIAVQENRTVLDVTNAKMKLNNVIEVRNYAEAAGIILAIKQGINLETIVRPLTTLRPKDMTCVPSNGQDIVGKLK